MRGPFRFDRAVIDANVPDKSKGNYALGRMNSKRSFVVRYVGRSDKNLRAELKTYLNRRYTHFKFSLAPTAEAAFEKECWNYHDFGGDSGLLVNDNHPDRPDGSDSECPVCTIFDEDDDE